MGLDAILAARLRRLNSIDRAQQIKDYVGLVRKLMWQRQGSFLLATILGVIYFNPVFTIACCAGVLLTEALDMAMCSRARTWDGKDPVVADMLMKRILINTALSSVAISAALIGMALQEPSNGHFAPLFFLFAASLFAAMHNSQIFDVLVLRLSIYSGSFLFIACIDIVRLRPPLGSSIWLNFFTVVLLLYFIINISLQFHQFYQEKLEQLRLINEECEKTKAASQIKSQFISTVSHEIRTPLTSIKGSLDLATSGALGQVPEKLARVLNIAAKNGQRLTTLVDDLLDLQKIEAGKMEFHFVKLNVNELVRESVEAAEGYAEKHDIHMTTSLPARALTVRGDSFRLAQVINNLLSNAIKFSKESGSVHVQVKSNGNHVRISVQDAGLGIPEDARVRLFQSFSQVDSSDRRKVAGTGLGLNIAKRIVEQHGGIIDYTSQQGVGSTFYVELPLLQSSY